MRTILLAALLALSFVSCDVVNLADFNDPRDPLSPTVGQPSKFSGKDLTEFSFKSSGNESAGLWVDALGSISGTTVNVSLPEGTDTSGLVATFTTSGSGVKVGSASQTSGVTPNSFASDVVYTTQALDGTTLDYTVKVAVGAPQYLGLYFPEANGATSFKFDLQGKTLTKLTFAPTNAMPPTEIIVDATGSFAVATFSATSAFPLSITKSSGALNANGGPALTVQATSTGYAFNALGTRLFSYGIAGSATIDMHTPANATWAKGSSAVLSMPLTVDALAVAPSGDYVFVANLNGPTSVSTSWGSVYAVKVNGAGVFSSVLGTSQPFKGTGLTMGPKYLAVDPKERFIVALSQTVSDRTVNAYAISTTGLTQSQNFQVGSATDSVPMIGGTTSPLGTNPVVIDPAGRHVHIAGSYSPSKYKIFSYALTDSGVDAASASVLDLDTDQPFSLTFDRTGRFAYLVSQQITPNKWKVTKYTVGSKGELTSANSVTTFSENVGGTGYSRPVLDSSGKYIFCFVMNSGSAYGLTVFDATTGTSIATSNFGSPISVTPLTVASVY